MSTLAGRSLLLFQSDAPAESVATRSVSTGILAKSVHSVQLAGDPDASVFLLSLLMHPDLSTGPKGTMARHHYLVTAEPGNAPQVTLLWSEFQSELGGLPPALPFRQAITFRDGTVEYRGVDCDLTPHLLSTNPGPKMALQIRLYKSFTDIHPTRQYSVEVPDAHAAQANLVCVYEQESASNTLLFVIFEKLPRAGSYYVKSVCAFELQAGSDPKVASLPKSIVVKSKSNDKGGAGILACEGFSCEFIPDQPDITVNRLVNGNPVFHSTVSTTNADGEYQVLGINKFQHTSAPCQPTIIDYRAWPPFDVSEVDVESSWNGTSWSLPPLQKSLTDLQNDYPHKAQAYAKGCRAKTFEEKQGSNTYLVVSVEDVV